MVEVSPPSATPSALLPDIEVELPRSDASFKFSSKKRWDTWFFNTAGLILLQKLRDPKRPSCTAPLISVGKADGMLRLKCSEHESTFYAHDSALYGLYEEHFATLLADPTHGSAFEEYSPTRPLVIAPGPTSRAAVLSTKRSIRKVRVISASSDSEDGAVDPLVSGHVAQSQVTANVLSDKIRAITGIDLTISDISVATAFDIIIKKLESATTLINASPLQDTLAALINKVDALSGHTGGKVAPINRPQSFSNAVTSSAGAQKAPTSKNSKSKKAESVKPTPKTPRSVKQPIKDGSSAVPKKSSSPPKSPPPKPIKRGEITAADAEKILNGESHLIRGFSRVYLTGFSRRPKYCDLRSALKQKGVDVTAIRNMMWVANSHLEVLIFVEKALPFVNLINSSGLKVQATFDFDPISYAYARDGEDGLRRLKDAYLYASKRLPEAMKSTRKELLSLMKTTEERWKAVRPSTPKEVPAATASATMMESL